MVTGPTVDGLHQAHGKARLYRRAVERARRAPMTVTALIVAAGSGQPHGRRRAQAISPARRQAGAGAMRSTRWRRHPAIDAVRVVIGEGQEELRARGARRPRRRRADHRRRERAGSGPRRASARDRRPTLVLVHDAARPFCPPDVIDRLLDGARQTNDGAVPVAARRRHAGARQGQAARRAGRPRRSWSGSRPRRRFGSRSASQRLSRAWTRRSPDRRSHASLAPPGSASPRSRATRCSTS